MSVIIANIIIFGSVVFLIGKAVWQDSESFKLWKWKKIFALKNWKERTEYRRNYKIKQLREKIPSLKRIYIIVASAIGLLLLYVFGLVYLEILNINWAEATSGNSGIRNLAIAFLGTTTGIGALFGVYLAILKSETNERQTQTAEQGMITDRINKATAGLGKNNDKGNPVVEVRLGALYALERIAQDSIRDHVQIVEILCAYVRTNSPFHDETNNLVKLREDILAAIKIIGRRKKWSDGEKRVETEEAQNCRIDLSHCDLNNADLYEAHLVGAMLFGANLSHANLIDANLENAYLNRTKLGFINLNRANLINAHLSEADLNHAQLSYAKMTDTKLGGANLRSAYLDNANINHAYLYHTNMQNVRTLKTYANICDFSTCENLTQEQLGVMFCGISVKIPNGLTRPKHWPKDDLLWKYFVKIYEKWKDNNP